MKKLLFALLLLLPLDAAHADTNLASYLPASLTNLDEFGGASASRQKSAQPFTVSVDGDVVSSVTITQGCRGTPVDQEQVSIYSDSAGAPGAALETGPAFSCTALVGGAGAPKTVTFTSTTVLHTSTTYWLVLSRTSSQNATNSYWFVIANSPVPTFGGVVGFNGTSWVADTGTGFNMYFQVNGVPAPAKFRSWQFWEL